MKIETLDDIIEELADKIGIHGHCKELESDDENECTLNAECGYFCCRVAFSMELDTRIREAMINEEKLNKAGF